jgi:AcrR family transcriptional regulator
MPSSRPRLRYKQQVRAALREALLRAAGVNLLREGCPDVRVEQIADACGIAKGTAYLQFPSRSDLLAGAVHRLDEQLAARLADPPSKIGGPRAALRWTVMAAVDAQIAALGRRPRDEGAASNGVCLWPCCHRMTPCPYGGPARSLSVLERFARAVSSRRSTAPATAELAGLLVHASVWRLVRPSRRAAATSHRRFIGRLFRHLLD